MKVLFVSPWFRTLAQIYGRALEDSGHEVLVVTTSAHFERGYGFTREIVFPPRLKDHAWPRQWLAVRRTLAGWHPDLVVLDQTWDLRLSSLARRFPRAVLVHDAGPHDITHLGPKWQRAVIARQRARAPRLVAFSSAVASRLAAETGNAVFTVPLTSEMPQELVRELAPAGRRRDFLVLGRVSPYKNLEVVFAAWRAYREDVRYQGDSLVLMGDGELHGPLPDGVRWERGRFSFADVADRLHLFKGSIVMYREASQSGAQLTSMQVGVSTIASDAAGLREYQPAFRPCLAVDDVGGLASALLELTDPARAAAEGSWARAHYEQAFLDEVSASRLLEACRDGR